MKIAITGGAGYVGSRLTPFLLERGHTVTVLDTFWFGDNLGEHEKLTKIRGDIRDAIALRAAFKGQDAVIHLACISNDPCFDMDKRLGESVNHTAFGGILSTIRSEDVEKFIYASSSSVYGVSKEEHVTEDTIQNPLTDYSKFKLWCEKELEDSNIGCDWTIIRPATVCGYAPRMRLDLVVNILTIQGIIDKEITIFGTKQKRPNIHIEDMCRAYEFALLTERAMGKTYNVGYENLTLLEIAELVKKTLGHNAIAITEKPVNDPRSYHINSDRIMADGFRPTHDIRTAIRSIWENRTRLLNPMQNPDYYNIKKMKELAL